MTPKKTKPEASTNRAQASKLTKMPRQFSPKSTATEAQYDRLLRLLRTGKRNTIELRKAGVIAPAARIKELKDEFAFDIPTVERIDMWDDEGFLHPRIAVYELQGEPEGVVR